MKVVFINSVCGVGSTGRICISLAKKYEEQGHECKIAYGRIDTVPEECKKYAVKIGSNVGVKINAVLSRLLDNHGLNAFFATKKFLKWLSVYSPDILWLHNLHGYYINYKMLFKWIKKHPELEVKWTLHDCWSFTGHCTHFSAVGCYKWESHCKKCPQRYVYPVAVGLENSRRNFKIKKESFTGVKNMKIYTPSNWLRDLVKRSFLKDYPIEVLYNEVDKTIFKPTKSDFREKYNLSNKKIILGVANVWDIRKGMEVFFSLSEMLDDTYKVVLVGLNEEQVSLVPSKVLGLKRTNSPKELAEIYTAADIFVNPSKEETFGLTTVEALYCGTKAIVYKDTACEEIAEKYGGIVVEQSTLAVYEAIKAIEKGV